jgi:transcriptional regulator with XRE-family HTH domain
MSISASSAHLSRYIRRKQGDSQYRLGKRMGVHHTYVWRVENQQSGFSACYAKRFCAAYRLDPYEFMLMAEALDGRWKSDNGPSPYSHIPQPLENIVGAACEQVKLSSLGDTLLK